MLEASPAVEPLGVDAASPAVAVRHVLEPMLVELPEVAFEPCDGTLLEAPEPVAVVELPLPVAEVRPPPLPRRREGVSGCLLSAIRR